MLKIGYPASLPDETVQLFPLGVELIPLSTTMQGEVAVDVWVPPPFPSAGEAIWPHLRGVSIVLTLTAGIDWLAELVGPEVTICNAQGAHNISTAEWVISAILNMLKYFSLYDRLKLAGDWRGRSQASAQYTAITGDTRPQYPAIMEEELTGKRVLMVGYGDIGKTIEKYLAAFDVQLTRVARSARSSPAVRAVAELDSLLPTAEIVILILPLTAESQGLIGAKQIALMQQGTLLVNAARGPVVDTGALVAALHSGHIRAALDVTDPEPLPANHPLWKCPNLLITPHIASQTPQFSPRAVKTAADQVRRLLAGEKLINVARPGVVRPGATS